MTRVEHIGLATLYLCDAREIALPACPIITDPPYGIGFGYSQHNDNEAEYGALIAFLRGRKLALLQYPEEMMRLVVPILGAPDDCLAWCYPSNLPRQFRLWGLWRMKPNFNNFKQPARNPECSKVANAMVSSYDWWEQPQVKNTSAEKTDHPCQLPVSNAARVIALCAPEAVTDPFMGSGSIGIAALAQGLPFVGCEIDPTYFDIACRRIEDAQRQGQLFEAVA